MSEMAVCKMDIHRENPNKQALDNFWKFVYERHSIWYKRFVLEEPGPWTNDWVLRDFKFTNVYRELDRGTMFLLDNILGKGEPIEQVWNIILYRMFNRIETYEAMGFQKIPWGENRKVEMFQRLRQRQDSKQPLYTDAHIVCAYASFPGKDKLERFQYIFNCVYDALPDIMRVIHGATSLEPIHKALMGVDGIGPFNAYEISVDVSYADWNDLHEDEWVNPGPGCMRGTRKIFPHLKEQEKMVMPYVIALRDSQDAEFARLGLGFGAIAYKGKRLTLRNVEHSLCEYFKWCKAMEGSGRPRNVFRPKAGKPTLNGDDNGFKRLKG